MLKHLLQNPILVEMKSENNPVSNAFINNNARNRFLFHLLPLLGFSLAYLYGLQRGSRSIQMFFVVVVALCCLLSTFWLFSLSKWPIFTDILFKLYTNRMHISLNTLVS